MTTVTPVTDSSELGTDDQGTADAPGSHYPPSPFRIWGRRLPPQTPAVKRTRSLKNKDKKPSVLQKIVGKVKPVVTEAESSGDTARPPPPDKDGPKVTPSEDKTKIVPVENSQASLKADKDSDLVQPSQKTVNLVVDGPQDAPPTPSSPENRPHEPSAPEMEGYRTVTIHDLYSYVTTADPNDGLNYLQLYIKEYARQGKENAEKAVSEWEKQFQNHSEQWKRDVDKLKEDVDKLKQDLKNKDFLIRGQSAELDALQKYKEESEEKLDRAKAEDIANEASIRELRDECQKKDTEASQASRRAAELLTENESLRGAKEQAETARRKAQEERDDLHAQLGTQDATLGRLRTKLSDMAGELAKAKQFSSALPESEMIAKWQDLDYEVHNFVQNYLSKMSERKLDKWFALDDSRLKEIHPKYKSWHKDQEMMTCLAEAFVWQTLLLQVFDGENSLGGLFWAGRDAKRLKRFRSYIYSSVNDDKGKDGPLQIQHQKMFHAWKAQSATLYASLSDDETRTQVLGDFVELLEEVLEPLCTYRHKKPLQDGVASIVAKAMAFDEAMCCQTKWYHLCSFEPRWDIMFDPKCMRPVKGNGPVVAFTVRPGLVRTGGERGEDYTYASRVVLDHCTVAIDPRRR